MLLDHPDAELVVRSHSIANSPRRNGVIGLLVTQVPGGLISDRLVVRPARLAGCRLIVRKAAAEPQISA